MSIDHDLSREIIEEWLTSQISKAINKQKSEIDINKPLAEYGLDSIHAVGLSGDIEDKFGVEIEPTIAWDYPTIAQMSDYLFLTIDSHINQMMQERQIVS